METDPFAVAAVAEDAFLNLGIEEIAYIRTIDIDGAIGTGIYSADGLQIATAPSIAIAQAMIREHGFEPALVH